MITAPRDTLTNTNTNTVLTPWKKSLKNRGLFNTLDNSKTPHLHPGKKHLENTLEHFSNTAQNGFGA